jgi:hypothetical protein
MQNILKNKNNRLAIKKDEKTQNVIKGVIKDLKVILKCQICGAERSATLKANSSIPWKCPNGCNAAMGKKTVDENIKKNTKREQRVNRSDKWASYVLKIKEELL